MRLRKLLGSAVMTVMTFLVATPVAAADSTPTTVPADHLGVGSAPYDKGSVQVSADHEDSEHSVGPKASPAPIIQHGMARQLPPLTLDMVEADPSLCTTASPYTMAETKDFCWMETPGLDMTTAPVVPGSQAQPASQYAVSYLRSLVLPVPHPEISAPNGGICGVMHSLDLHIPAQQVYTDPDTAFGPLVVHVFATVTVDWGDGTTSIYHDDTGSPWPHSIIEHSWNISQRYDIAVTVDWNANWSFGTYSGVASGYRTTGAITQWPVYELQAVITEG